VTASPAQPAWFRAPGAWRRRRRVGTPSRTRHQVPMRTSRVEVESLITAKRAPNRARGPDGAMAPSRISPTRHRRRAATTGGAQPEEIRRADSMHREVASCGRRSRRGQRRPRPDVVHRLAGPRRVLRHQQRSRAPSRPRSARRAPRRSLRKSRTSWSQACRASDSASGRDRRGRGGAGLRRSFLRGEADSLPALERGALKSCRVVSSPIRNCAGGKRVHGNVWTSLEFQHACPLTPFQLSIAHRRGRGRWTIPRGWRRRRGGLGGARWRVPAPGPGAATFGRQEAERLATRRVLGAGRAGGVRSSPAGEASATRGLVSRPGLRAWSGAGGAA
jgi:hypothetical protein